LVWDAANGVHLIAVPGGEYSSALALDSLGEVVMRATPGGLFLYSGGKLEALDIAKATPRGLNRSGVVVGSFGPGPETQHAFVWDKVHGTRNLNPLIPLNSGWTPEVASSVNDRGEIVGMGDHGGTENAGFHLRVRGGANTISPVCTQKQSTNSLAVIFFAELCSPKERRRSGWNAASVRYQS
jgi:hypothetical protein